METIIKVTSTEQGGSLPLPDQASMVWLDLAGQYAGRQQWPTSATQGLHKLQITGKWVSVYLYADEGRVRMRASGDKGDAITVYLLTRQGWQPAVIHEKEYQDWHRRNRATLAPLEADLALGLGRRSEPGETPAKIFPF